MKRLSLLDALFLYAETPETPMHIARVTIFKPESPQDDLFARFREHTAARLDVLPSYRRRLEPTPLGNRSKAATRCGSTISSKGWRAAPSPSTSRLITA